MSSSPNIAPIAASYLGPNTSPSRLPAGQPLFLLHGFRWARTAIRIHVILKDVSEAAPDYTMSSSSNAAFIASFRKLHPEQTRRLPRLQMVEEYDPDADDGTLPEFAWVANVVVRLDSAGSYQGGGGGGSDGTFHAVSSDVGAVIAKGVEKEAWAAVTELRDELSKDESVGWWIVYNADPERTGSDDEDDDEEESVRSGSYL